MRKKKEKTYSLVAKHNQLVRAAQSLKTRVHSFRLSGSYVEKQGNWMGLD